MLCKMESLTFDSLKHNRMQKNTRSNDNSSGLTFNENHIIMCIEVNECGRDVSFQRQAKCL
jgi:hypothetical protein